MATTRLSQQQSESLKALCLRHGIRRLALFGSILRGDFSPQSDVDVLVEFEPGRVPGYLGLGALEAALSQLLSGRKVDLHTPASLNLDFRDQVLSEAEVQFERHEG